MKNYIKTMYNLLCRIEFLDKKNTALEQRVERQDELLGESADMLKQAREHILTLEAGKPEIDWENIPPTQKQYLGAKKIEELQAQNRALTLKISALERDEETP